MCLVYGYNGVNCVWEVSMRGFLYVISVWWLPMVAVLCLVVEVFTFALVIIS